MLGAEHLLLPPEERSASWRNSDYTEVYRLTMVMVVVVMVVVMVVVVVVMLVVVVIVFGHDLLLSKMFFVTGTCHLE